MLRGRGLQTPIQRSFAIAGVATLVLLMVLSLGLHVEQAAATDPSPILVPRAWLPLVSCQCLPVPYPTPSFFWGTCFNSLDDVGNYWLERGGRYRIVDDPANSGRGKVLEATAAADLAYFEPTYCGGVGETIVRSYPDKYWPAEPGRHLTCVDVYVESSMSPLPGWAPWLSLLSDFYDSGAYGSGWDVGPMANLRPIGDEF